MKISYHDYIDKSYKGTPQVYFDYIYRALSHPFTYVFLRFGFSPNHFSVSSSIFAILAGIVIAMGYPIMGLFVFMLSYLFDFCDGNAARVIIKIKGMSDIDKCRGLLIENFNTNLSLFILYGSLGYYFSVIFDNIIFLIFAFFVFGTKMIVRYTARQESDLLKNYLRSTDPGKKFMMEYKISLKNKIKFFIRKSLFSANFYYIIYLFSFSFFEEKTWIIFVLYGMADMFMHVIRLVMISTRIYVK
jgi:hypothetical protein